MKTLSNRLYIPFAASSLILSHKLNIISNRTVRSRRTRQTRFKPLSSSESNISLNASREPLIKSEADAKRLKSGSFVKRTTFGVLLALLGVVVVLSGGLLYTCIVAACAYQVSREFNGMILLIGEKKKTFAPPISIRELMSVFCLLFPFFSYFYAHESKSSLLLSVAVFILLCMEVLVVRKPKFSQLAAAVFGLFYCGQGLFFVSGGDYSGLGFLPSFWVKLRMLSVPAVNTSFISDWPVPSPESSRD